MGTETEARLIRAKTFSHSMAPARSLLRRNAVREKRIDWRSDLAPAASINHEFAQVRIFANHLDNAPAFSPAGLAHSDQSARRNATAAPAPAPAPTPAPTPAPAPTAKPAAQPSLSLANDSYTDAGNTSHKNIRFDVSVPAGLTAGEYCLVNKLQGSMRKADGTYHQVQMYGSVVDFNFATEQVDSVDPDPVYWSNATARWNYTATGSGFYATDDPGPPGYTFNKGDVAAVKFKIGLYRLADVPTTTSGSLSATPIEEKPWQYSVKADATSGALSHPAL